jgi:AraC-like DNA-binding protein
MIPQRQVNWMQDPAERTHAAPEPSEFSSACAERCLPAFFDGIDAKLNSPLLHRAMELLRDNPERYVSVEEWAMDAGVSREHLTRSIAPTINPHALLQASRVCLALSELAQQDTLQAGRALERMGYNSRAHAFAVFKKVTGLTPTEFWNTIHDPEIHDSCVVKRCPLVGAVLDRYKRSGGASV